MQLPEDFFLDSTFFEKRQAVQRLGVLPNGILSYLPSSQQSTKEMVYLITLINTLKYQKLFCILYSDCSRISQMTCDLE